MVFAAHGAMLLCGALSTSIALAAPSDTKEGVALLRLALMLRWASIVATAIYLDEERKARELWD